MPRVWSRNCARIGMHGGRRQSAHGLRPRKREARLSKPGANSRRIEHDLGGGERSAREAMAVQDPPDSRDLPGRKGPAQPRWCRFNSTLDDAKATVRNAGWCEVICAESLESLSLETK